MNSLVKYLFFVAFSAISTLSFAQEQQEMDPVEAAAKEVTYLTTYLELKDTQIFFVDSIIINNFTGLFNEFEDLRDSGRQNADTYKFIQEKWLKKNMTALEAVLDEQQYIKYLKHIGKGKEYKRGKDGLYYKKEDSEKKKGSDKKR